MSIIPPNFDPENTIFITQSILVKWSNKTRLHYEQLGYIYTGWLDTFEVSVNHISANSNLGIQVQCPICDKARKAKFQALSKSGHTICKSCVTHMRCFRDLTDLRFERLIVLNRIESNDNKTWWRCECDCGNEHIARSDQLLCGDVRSCGCLMRETSSKTASARVGKNHPMYGLRGDKSPFWDSTKSEDERVNRRHIEGYSDWRIAVYETHSYTCVVCGDDTGGNLNAHHLNSWDTYPLQRLEVANGVCLCDTCHREFHSIYGYGDNTRQQFEDFVKLHPND